jgi:hypothetical protein
VSTPPLALDSSIEKKWKCYAKSETEEKGNSNEGMNEMK